MAKEIDNVIGILFNLISMLLFVSLDILVKKLVVDLPVYEVIFFRCIFGIPIFIFIVYFTTGLSSLRMVNKKLQLCRAFLGIAGMFFFFNSYKYLAMADAASILFSAPLILTVLSVVFLKEKVGLHRVSAIIVGFIGVLFIVRPVGNSLSFHMLLPVMGAVIWSVVIIVMRVLSRTDHANAVTLVFSLLGSCVGFGLVMYNGGFSPNITPLQFVMLIGTGIVGIFAQWFMTKAVEWSEASVFASTKYVNLVFSILAGLIVFGEVPVFYSIIGIVLIVVSGLYNVYREYVLNKIQKARMIRY